MRSKQTVDKQKIEKKKKSRHNILKVVKIF